jgi:flagellar hook assembly protein FlgD
MKLNTRKYNYRLKQIDNNGNFEYYNLSAVVEVGVPAKYDISQNYLNTFNPSTKIDYQLPRDSKVSIRVYDITGREVKTLLNNEQRAAGYYTIDFDGTNILSGVYFYRLQSPDFTDTKRMMLVK